MGLMAPPRPRPPPTCYCRWALRFFALARDRHVSVAAPCLRRKEGRSGDFICGSRGGAGRVGPRPGSEGGGARHGGAASPGPSDAGSPGERIWAVRGGCGQRQKEDEARGAPRKGTRREGSGQTTPRPRERRHAAGKRGRGEVEKRREPCSAGEEKRGHSQVAADSC